MAKKTTKGLVKDTAIPPIDNVVQRSYEALKKGKLLGFQCNKCKTYGILAMGYSCPHCGSFDLTETTLSGKGKLLPCSTVVYPMPGINEKPYIAATVELDEGPVLTGRLYDVPKFDFDKPAKILDLIGMNVKMDVRKETVFGLKGQYCICFVPAK